MEPSEGFFIPRTITINVDKEPNTLINREMKGKLNVSKTKGQKVDLKHQPSVSNASQSGASKVKAKQIKKLYNNQEWKFCHICDTDIKLSYFSKHLKRIHKGYKPIHPYRLQILV